MLTRKRKRSQTSPAPEDDSDTDDGSNSEQHPTVDGLQQKESEIWEALKEEHHEAIEELSLNLHRQYTLLQELDRSVARRRDDISFMLLDYITKRQEMAPPSRTQATLFGHSHPEGEDAIAVSMTNLTLAEPIAHAREDVPHSTPFGNHTATREALTRIACKIEEWERTSEEKVNVAGAAKDSVDRQLRILQLAVAQQESSIAKDGGSGYMAPSLPDLSILRTNRPLRPSTVTPLDGGEIEGGGLTIQRENDRSESVSMADKAKKGHPKTQGGRSKQDEVEASLKITLPAQPTSADTDDKAYCYCNQGSFGEMVACDGKKCEREWFHLECAGLAVSPEDGAPWYCRDCRPMPRRKRK